MEWALEVARWVLVAFRWFLEQLETQTFQSIGLFIILWHVLRLREENKDIENKIEDLRRDIAAKPRERCRHARMAEAPNAELADHLLRTADAPADDQARRGDDKAPPLG